MHMADTAPSPLAATSSGQALAELAEDLGAPPEVQEMLLLVGQGVPLNLHSVWLALREEFYTHAKMGVVTAGLAAPKYADKNDALNACREHLGRAITIVSEQRRRFQAHTIEADLEFVINRYHELAAKLSKALDNTPPAHPSFVKLSAELRQTNRDIAALAGKSIGSELNVKVKGDPANPIPHEHSGSLSGYAAAWDGGTDDLKTAVIEDAEFTEET